MKTRRILSCIILILCIGLSSFQSAKVVGQQSEILCSTREQFEYYCSYVPDFGIRDELTIHTIEIEVSNLEPGDKEIQFVLSTEDNLRTIQPLTAIVDTPRNESRDDKIFITLHTTEEYLLLRLILNDTKQSFDPLDVTTLPLGVSMHPKTSTGNLNFDFWMNNSEYLDSCSFSFRSRGSEIQNLNLVSSDLMSESNKNYYGSFFMMSNVSVGCGQVSFQANINSLSDYVQCKVTAAKNNQDAPIQCQVNGDNVSTFHSVLAVYDLGDYHFSIQGSPYYYYGNEATFFLNFTAPSDFTLRLSPFSRENICSLQFDKMPRNFTVVKTSYLGDPCYLFEFHFDYQPICEMSLTLKRAEWFIDSENLSLKDIPDSVAKEYLDPSSSDDGSLFDVDDEFVQKWAREVAGNQTNPYIIASDIFENLTNTITFPKDWEQLQENNTFVEDVSGILELKLGVCRHFAKAYTALCICSGIPARTVRGTAFSNLTTFQEKNHKWTEIYLPGYTWVTVDASWNQSFVLDERHAKVTYWTYLNDNLNVSEINSTITSQLALDSKEDLSYIIQLCRNFTGDNVNSEIFLDKANFNLKQGNVHEALLCVADAYILYTNENTKLSSNNYSYILLAVLLLSLALFFIILKFYGKIKQQKCSLVQENRLKT